MGPEISPQASNDEPTNATTPALPPGLELGRTRRSLLAAGIGATGAFIASAIGRPAPVDAASVVLGATNNEATATRFNNTAASSAAIGVAGRTTYTGAAANSRGVSGISDGQNGVGVHGQASIGTGSRGVLGVSTNGTGVLGSSTNGKGVVGTGKTAGVYGNGVGNGAAVQGYAQGPGFGYGVSGLSEKSSGVIGSSLVASGFAAGIYGSGSSPGGAGVYGSNTYGGTGVWAHTYGGWALYAEANYAAGQPEAYAAYFVGKTHVAGTFSKTAGTFLIDHPLDPANKTLAHSFVEAPERLNVYRGNVTLDAKGRATVNLPSYFHALNETFSYQLTAIGGPAPDLHVAKKVVNGRFDIAGGAAGQEIAWQVTGARADAWAKANPLEVEKQKQSADRGRYLNPEAHGKPGSERVNYRPAPTAQVAPKD